MNVNVALKRPTFYISVHSEHPYVASHAVDGNNDTNIGNCFHSTLEGNNPWWAVDLGAALVVARVLFTNRGDCCGTSPITYSVVVAMKLGSAPSAASRPLSHGLRQHMAYGS